MGKTHLIRNDQEALEIADHFARQIEAESAERDKHRRLPFHEMELFSESGLLGMTVPKSYGGPGVSTVTFVKAVALISSADASVGQIPQNHYANVEEIRLVGTEAQKSFFFGRILQGDRLGNAAVERAGKDVFDNQTRLVRNGTGYLLNGEKFYCTGALYAHWVPVRTIDPEGNRVVAIVNRQSEGLTVIDDWSSFGQRTTASGTVVLRNVRVTNDQILRSFEAYTKPTTRGPFSQIIHVAIDVGIAQAALKETAHFLRTDSAPVERFQAQAAAEDPLTFISLGNSNADCMRQKLLWNERRKRSIRRIPRRVMNRYLQPRSPWPKQRLPAPRWRCRRPTSCLSWLDQNPCAADMASIGTGGTHASTLFTTRSAGSTTQSAISI
jgi:alkylation response protein AidB-like acyl-CoA dehydrogenase